MLGSASPACCTSDALVRRKHAWQLAGDAGVSMVLVLGHALVLMCEGMAFSVAMNSKRAPALIALVIASNFGEIKGAHWWCASASSDGRQLHANKCCLWQRAACLS